jgi:hypothetical protein
MESPCHPHAGTSGSVRRQAARLCGVRPRRQRPVDSQEFHKPCFISPVPGFHSLGGYHHATWTGISGDNFHGRFVGADPSLVSNSWLEEHIRSKGPLGQQYPQVKFLMEGDTPTFFHLINNGLGMIPSTPTGAAGAGGMNYTRRRFANGSSNPRRVPFWADAEDEVLGMDGKWHTGNKETIWRWRPAYQNDFAARMNWSVTTNYARANHPPVAKLRHRADTEGQAWRGRSSSAPKVRPIPTGMRCRINGFIIPSRAHSRLSTARTGVPLKIENAEPNERIIHRARRSLAKLARCTSFWPSPTNGTPALTRYQRVIVEVKP